MSSSRKPARKAGCSATGKAWGGSTRIKKTWDYHHPRLRTAEAVRFSFAELTTDLALNLFPLAAGPPLRFDGALGQRFLDQGRMDDLVVAGLNSFQLGADDVRHGAFEFPIAFAREVFDNRFDRFTRERRHNRQQVGNARLVFRVKTHARLIVCHGRHDFLAGRFQIFQQIDAALVSFVGFGHFL